MSNLSNVTHEELVEALEQQQEQFQSMHKRARRAERKLELIGQLSNQYGSVPTWWLDNILNESDREQ
jgi:DNA repair exonuclease SbcCD ATPase subunit